ncbi:MAG: DUF3383 domain-containing protein [Candidatus Diapherotrites archaeon]|nr:DUF3383 domain-containing protein [Candidatus Diapherotrites archaeon]
MTLGLNISRLVRVTVNLSPVSASRRGFGTLLAVGDTDVIDGLERLQSFTSVEGILEAGFQTTDPEYLAGALYFGQTPKPSTFMIGRWLQSATAGFNNGGAVAVADQAALLATLLLVTDATFQITVDATAVSITATEAMDLSGGVTLSGIAAIIQAELQLQEAGTLCVWDGTKFVITSPTTGVSSLVSAATAGVDGTDIATTIKMTAALYTGLVPGYAAETPVEAITALANKSGEWYGSMFAVTNALTDDENIAVAAYINSATPSRVFGVTTIDANVLESTSTTDIAYKLEALAYKRTITTYSATDANAIASMFGRAFSVNFEANRSTITLMYKQMPGIVAEFITETQALTLDAKKCNIFVEYNNDTAIFQTSVMASGAFFDEIHGLDWFADALQTACYNLLFTSKTKIPQTESGGNEIVNVANGVCEEAVNNGLVAGGVWNSDGFGQLERGEELPSGFYVYMQPMADQDQSERDERKAPPMQIALKLAGAVHEIDVIVDVNR